jgi:hypothetical protein
MKRLVFPSMPRLLLTTMVAPIRFFECEDNVSFARLAVSLRMAWSRVISNHLARTSAR